MKIKDLRVCDNCGEKLSVVIYAIEIKQGILDHKAIDRFLGLMRMMNDNMALATAMGPDEDVVKFAPGSNKLLLCQDCALIKEISLGELIQNQINKEKSDG